MNDLAIVNIARICTGDLNQPLDNGDTVVIRDGRIAEIGVGLEADGLATLDAQQNVLAPGLIDSHVHTVFGDWTPRQNTLGFLESYVHGGITRVLSASEVHLPGRPTDPAGVKALALVAHRSFQKLRPNGMTVHGGSLILEPGLVEDDFAELAAQGVWQAKAGMGNFHPSRDVAPLVRLAQKHGFKVMCHTGGVSIPDSSPVSADDLLEIAPDVAGHVNGGTTSLPDEDLPRVVASGIALQLCQAGNLRSALQILHLANQQDALNRVLIATDTPTGTGVMPLGMIKSVAELSSLAGMSAEDVICLATGNAASVYGIDAGIIAIGQRADLILLDAPLASAATNALAAIERGDIPSVTCVITDGIVRLIRSRNTPPPNNLPQHLDPVAPKRPRVAGIAVTRDNR